jgi:hypothetical protein
MPLFLEHVVLKAGETVAMILDRYGIENSRWPEIRQLPQNARAFPGAGSSTVELRAGPPQVASLDIPIGPFATVVNYRIAKDTVIGLRPSNMAWTREQRAEFVKETAHGVDIMAEHGGNPCIALRWVQTVKKRNAKRSLLLINSPQVFVDSGLTGFPFYSFDESNPEPDGPFDDTPCGSAPSKMGDGLEFQATLSLVVWTHPRITIVMGWMYHFFIAPTGALWRVKPRDATVTEFAEQVRILQAGVGVAGQDTGKGLDYRVPPPLGSVNR